MTLYSALRSEWDRLGTEMIGISVDGPWCHMAFAETRNLNLTLLADFEPKGAVSRAYGVYDQREGTSERALFVIDAEGIIRWSYVSPPEVNPGADGILEELEKLTPARAAL
jgi:peroxiredoxin